MRLRFAVYAVAALTLAGCGERRDEALGGGTINVSTADVATVIAKLGDVPVTCGDFRKRLDFECGIWKLRQRKAKSQNVQGFRASRLKKVLPALLNQMGTEAWAAERKISLTEEERRTAERETLLRLKFKGSLEDFAKKTGCDAAYASRQLCAAALTEKARIDFEPASTNLTEKEIDDGLARLAAYYERAMATNAVTWATCSNVIREIRAGLDFAEAARRYGHESEEEGQLWGEFVPDEIEDAKLKKWAHSAPVGSMEIFELDDGISIVKILRRREGATEKSLAAAVESEATLARINFLMVEPEPEPRTREHVREALLKWKADGAKKRLMEKILGAYPITYPNKDAKLEL